MMKNFLERNFPPGYSYASELKAVFSGIAIAVLISLLSFWGAYSAEIQSLYRPVGADLILDETRIMPDFVYILSDNLLILLILSAFIFILVSLVHYAYYQSGSRSIYLMRRLPNRFELHKRALLIPLISALLAVLLAVLLLIIYYAVYMLWTPQACLTPNQWQKIWRVFQ